ncbi:major histocompatibility complex class I-related gene protein [Alligator mississippiensis]|uniref:major histocompatibility complex class I-related gene protein n=1 Tax=Alligator mississippiensis TaxID=8496 RepID=UPI0028775EBC|nr:major histocompatibility complex class I-related gene protein [Alligator mississippiensis]
MVTPAGFHCYRHLYMGVLDPSQGVPYFTAMSYVDDQKILHYDSETRRQEPREDWVQGTVGPDFWDRETRSLWGWQGGFQSNLVTLWYCYNQTSGECEQAGSHILHLMYGCELHEDNSTGGSMRFGYDGGDFISYDLRTRTWVAETTQAQVTQRRWNEDKALLQDARAYLEETCTTWLRKYLQHGEAALQSKHPVAQVSNRPSWDRCTIVSCQVHSFYPRDVAVVWLKNGEAQPQETNRSGVLPSGDGTYQTWATIEIDPSSNHNYTCSVEHKSLGAALRVAWDKGRTESDPMQIEGIVIAVGVIAQLVAMAGTGVCCVTQEAVEREAFEAAEKEAVESEASDAMEREALESEALASKALASSSECQHDGPDAGEGRLGPGAEQLKSHHGMWANLTVNTEPG